jgi:hypothetical protein
MITPKELQYIKELLEALQRKCKTDALYCNTRDGIRIIERELDFAGFRETESRKYD